MTRLMLIGQFAAMTRISVRMLRHYDDRGLLRPAHVDQATGYRYYHIDQAATAEVIRLLRIFDMPLNDISRVLESVGTGELPLLLAEHRERIEAKIEERRRSLAYLDRLIASLEAGNDVLSGEVSLREFDPREIISHRERRTLDDVGAFTGQTIGWLYQAAGECSLTPTGSPFALYYLPDEDGNGFDVEICLPVTGSPGEALPVGSRLVTGGSHAVLTHVGPYESLGAAYRTLSRWMAAHDAEPAGPVRETYLTAPAPELPPDEYRTQLAWPVRTDASRRWFDDDSS